jgi:hypothetical protein
MRALEKRLPRLEEGLLPPAETAESRELHEVVSGYPASPRGQAWQTSVPLKP